MGCGDGGGVEMGEVAVGGRDKKVAVGGRDGVGCGGRERWKRWRWEVEMEEVAVGGRDGRRWWRWEVDRRGGGGGR